jgi:hypothetical protein
LEEKRLGFGKKNSSADSDLFERLRLKYNYLEDLESLEDYQAWKTWQISLRASKILGTRANSEVVQVVQSS